MLAAVVPPRLLSLASSSPRRLWPTKLSTKPHSNSNPNSNSHLNSNSLLRPLASPLFASSSPLTCKEDLKQQPLIDQEEEEEEEGSSNGDTAWKIFVENVSGEWDGYGATFSSDGKPLELPSNVVPDAFREWEVTLYDWQTQCPTIAKCLEKSIQYKSVRLLPTVGCEADAATRYSVDERCIDDRESGGADALAFHINGSYIAIWPGKRVLKEDMKTRGPSKSVVFEGGDRHTALEVEHCLVKEGTPSFRVRISQHIGFHEDEPYLKEITVHRERWESEYRNGEMLGGCSTSGSSFAAGTPLQASELSDTWIAQKYLAKRSLESGSGSNIVQLKLEGSEVFRKEGMQHLVLLPEGLWTRLIPADNYQFVSEAGWLIGTGSAIISKCELDTCGDFQIASLAFAEQNAD